MRSLVIILFSLILFSCKNVDLAPIYENKTTETAKSERALGPIYENIRLENGHERQAIRPLWSFEKFEDKVAMDFIWPLSMSRLENDYYRSHFLLFFYHNMDVTEEDSEYLFWLFPLWFQGQDRDKQDYKGLFPIWGEVRDVVGFDSIKFHFFPIHLETRKNKILSESWLWPIYTTTSGPKVQKWNVWPFYGEKWEKEKAESSFVLWPFWHEGKSLVPGKKGEWFFFFPLYGKYDFEDSTKTTVLWPFFSWSSSDKDEALQAPWPFYTERETKDGREEKFTAWPFYTSYKAPNKITKQYVWPIGTYSRIGDETNYEEREWWLPFYWSTIIAQEGHIKEDYTRIWPFYSKTVHGQQENISILSLWPQRHYPAIERNWQTIWEPYRYYRDEKKISHDIFWGLSKYKEDKEKDTDHFSIFPFYEKSREAKKNDWSILKGFVGKKDLDESTKEYRLLWFIKFEAAR